MAAYTPVAAVLGDINLVSDGTNIDAASVNPALQDIANGVAFEAARLNSTLACMDLVRAASDVGLGIALPIGGVTTQTASILSAGSVATLVGDIVEVEFTSAVTFTNGATITNPNTLRCKLQASENGGALADIAGTGISVQSVQIASKSSRFPLSLRGVLGVATAGTIAFSVKADLTSSNVGDSAVCSTEPWVATYKIHRKL